jgi:hypothetical protein
LAHRPLDRRYSALWPELAADIGEPTAALTLYKQSQLTSIPTPA